MPDAPAPHPGQVTLTIDGREISVPRGTLVVEAAKLVSVEVPVFCYHHRLDPVGACRLCMVEISPGPPKPQTACTTPVAEGMIVSTNSPMAAAARADILEYELVNHPLDCPVCDKGGECPLQDFTFRHGIPTSQVDGPRLHFQKPLPLSDRIALDRERCVLCYRCTRYYDEIAWEQELTADNRGVQTYIASQFGEPLKSVFSGNIIDLCPVGALTSRVWRFESRPWDMDHAASVCSRCAVGCSVTLWQRRHQLVRVTSHENPAIDDGWICDRGRFEYTELNDPGRLRVPEIGGAPATWDAALEAVATGTRSGRLGIHLRRDVTNEELHLLRRLLDGPWKGARVVMENRTGLPAPGGETLRIEDLDRCRTIVVIATDTAADAPIVNLRIKKAVSKLGAALVIVNPGDVDLDRWRQARHVRYEPGGAADAVAGLDPAELAGEDAGGGWSAVGIVYGDGAGAEDGGALASAVARLAAATGGRAMPLYRATNERGALAAGVLSGHSDLVGCEAVLAWGRPEPGALPAQPRFLALWDILRRDELPRPSVLLPDAGFAETQGSYTNLEGRVQFLRPVLPLEPPLREGWDVLAEIGRRLGVAGMDTFAGVRQVQREAAAQVSAFADLGQPPDPDPAPRSVMVGSSRP